MRMAEARRLVSDVHVLDERSERCTSELHTHTHGSTANAQPSLSHTHASSSICWQLLTTLTCRSMEQATENEAQPSARVL